MDIELLKTFIEVKNTRHFGNAAEHLYLTQAAVSARIRQLENYLGTPLFTRWRNNLQLTPSGERLVAHAESILIAWDRAKLDISLRKHQRKVFSMGATTGLWDLLLKDILNRLHIQMPELSIRADADTPSVLIRRLMDKTLDVALIYEPAKLSDLQSENVSQTELMLVSTTKDVDINEAITKFVHVDWGTSFEITLAHHFPDRLLPVLRTSLARIALDFILVHGGCAYLPHKLIKNLLGEKLFVVNEAPMINRQIYICSHINNLNSDIVMRIIENIRVAQLN
ncbi:MAG: LysR family transcriptional regulator [Gammaproteobacteria bacterium CG22_combo_CG10-13_8_21_14_all_40_8]|nr:MAG: LysR family transcriptional regulator [Gammaproteobacteria bacterium CG22_combo_CG10-13_8_21_14_all_40_8]